MIIYLDTSALLKLYVKEPGTIEVRRAISAAKTSYTHLIAYAEMRAAFAKAVRLTRITTTAAARHRRELDRDWEQLGVLTPDHTMIKRAGDLAERYGLRGYDSVHLAAAESLLVDHRRRAVRLACFDDRLNKAARELGLAVLNDKT